MMLAECDRIAVLQTVFRCSGAAARRLDQQAQWARVDGSGYLVHQGDVHARCHVVVSGSASIRALGQEGRYHQICTVEPGEFFGCYPHPHEAPADVRASGAMEILSYDAGALAGLALAEAEVGAGLARMLAGQLANILGRFALRVTLTAAGRIHALVLDMTSADGIIAPVPSVSALAVQAQTTRETASRAISALERRGIMRREGSRWVIASRRLLEELVV